MSLIIKRKKITIKIQEEEETRITLQTYIKIFNIKEKKLLLFVFFKIKEIY